MNDDASLKVLLKRVLDDATALVRGELRLAQAEITEKIAKTQNHFIGIIAGLLLAFCGLLTLIQAIVLGLSTVMPAWLASVVTGVVLVGIAMGIIKSHQADLKKADLKPRRSIRSLKKDKDVVMEHAA